MSSFDKTRLHQIDDRSKKIVNGYIREFESSFKQQIIIPNLINYICLTYYCILLKWDEKLIGNDWIIRNNTIRKKTGSYNWHAAF